MKKLFLYTGASITLLFSVLHALFWKLGNWSHELPKLSPDNSGIVQMLNVVSIYTLVFGALITFRLAKKQRFEFLEKVFFIYMAGYYLMRIAFGYPFFGFSVVELIVWIMCLVVASCYLFALTENKMVLPKTLIGSR